MCVSVDWTGKRPGPNTAMDALVVQTSNGAVRGVTDGNVSIFKGTPFTAPRVGDNRWCPLSLWFVGRERERRQVWRRFAPRLLAKAPCIGPIPSTTKLSRLKESLGVAIGLPVEDMHFLEEVSSAIKLSSQNTSDQQRSDLEIGWRRQF